MTTALLVLAGLTAWTALVALPLGIVLGRAIKRADQSSPSS